MRLLEVPDIVSLIHSIGLKPFYLQLINQLNDDFRRWDSFQKSPRFASYYDNGVIELMPCSDEQLYSFKYVNGHPDNTRQGKLSVAAIGLLADVNTGYPMLVSEMTLLTAIRTAAVAALGAKHLARPDSTILAIIGTGAQSEFQAMAMTTIFDLQEIRIFDIDKEAMNKFSNNLKQEMSCIVQCQSINEAVKYADIIITATAAKNSVCLFTENDIKPGTHIHAMGGDCPGKTELGKDLLSMSKVVVEFHEQSLVEGEIQQLEHGEFYAELWQIICKHKAGRSDPDEITILDSVGFALEDFSTLKLINKLAEESGAGKSVQLVPDLLDPKNLYGLIKQEKLADY